MGERPVVSFYQFLVHPLDLGGGPTVRAQPEEEAGLQLRQGGYHTTIMHTGVRFRSDYCRDTSADHAYNHNSDVPLSKSQLVYAIMT